MDKSSRWDIDLEEQRRAWNKWNSAVEPDGPRQVAEWAEIERHLLSLRRTNLRMVEVGCGAGWLAERLIKYGTLTATDLSDEVLPEIRVRLPLVDFRVGDFFELQLPSASYDMVVTQHVLAHVGDQQEFVARLAALLVKGGRLIMATQNRSVLERWSTVPGPYPGQLRHWVNARELKSLLRPHFAKIEITSVLPAGDQGFLRLTNSFKVNHIMERFFSVESIRKTKEKALLGQSLIVCATR